MTQNVRVHIIFRILALLLGLGAMAGCFSGFGTEHHLALQSGVAMLGGAIIAFCIAFWPKYQSSLANRLLIIGCCTFLLGATWIMAKSETTYVSFPGALTLLSAGLLLMALFLPKRFFN